jgi:hypothetical protein
MALGGCYTPTKKLSLRVELPAELASRAEQLRVLPGIAEVRRELGRGAVGVELKREAGKVRLELPGACPLWLDTRRLADHSEVSLERLFELGPTERVVGLGRSFELRALPGCREAEAARSRFTVVAGAALTQLELALDGRSLSATTQKSLPDLEAEPGIVAVSAREQRRSRTELSFRIELPGGIAIDRQLFVSALARSSGLPNVGLSHPVLLAGDGWQLLERPGDSSATLRAIGPVTELVPDVPGLYRARDGAQRELSVRAGRYDLTPLDCGRSDCHAAIAASARNSPMTQVLASDLGGCHELSDPSCAIACHTTGEPGTRDGGFSHVMDQLALSALPPDYEQLPRALRRLGGVGCMACHGPTRIPEPAARLHLLSNDVCAVCHDAPPRYGHVMALEASRMGHADSRPETRAQPCARCHTNWGALGRTAPSAQADQPGGGISCVTCHDVHPHGQQARDAEPSHAGLLRSLPVAASLSDLPPGLLGTSRVCISCHSPSDGAPEPEASAAVIVAGTGGLVPTDGAELRLAGPHSRDMRGCLSCHDGGPEPLVLGRSHAFRASEQACARCHASPPPRDPGIARRARALLERLEPGQSSGAAPQPWHARRAATTPTTPTRARALRNVLLVLEDPAADVHHPRYARALLDAAETGASR